MLRLAVRLGRAVGFVVFHNRNKLNPVDTTGGIDLINGQQGAVTDTFPVNGNRSGKRHNNTYFNLLCSTLLEYPGQRQNHNNGDDRHDQGNPKGTV